MQALTMECQKPMNAQDIVDINQARSGEFGYKDLRERSEGRLELRLTSLSLASLATFRGLSS